MIGLLHFYRKQAYIQNAPGKLFEKKPAFYFTPEQKTCPVCNRSLSILKTGSRTVKSIGIGVFKAHHTTLYCSEHPDIGNYRSTELSLIVPPDSNIAYDVIVETGKLRFMENRQVAEIQLILLKRHSISISTSKIELLINDFVFYVAAVHKNNNGIIKNYINAQGGYILHLDATCEGDSPKLVSSIDPISGFVLYSAKLKSENKDDLAEFLEEINNRLGRPHAVVSDMGKGITAAVIHVFGNIPHYICHFHFLKAIGATLFDKEQTALRKALSKAGISGSLKKLRRELSNKFACLPLEKVESFLTEPKKIGKDLESSELSVYYLVLWILDYNYDGNGYGFPFDHSHLNFYKRLKVAYSIIQDAVMNYSTKSKNNKLVWKLYHLLKAIVEDSSLKAHESKYEIKLAEFSNLRDAFDTVPKDVKNGLCKMKDTVSSFKELQAIKNAVEKFKLKLKKKIKTINDKQVCNKLLNIIKSLDQYGERLFSDPLIVEINGELKLFFIHRTNNIMEHHFRRFNYSCRRIHGNHSVRRNLENIPSQLSLIENLENLNYMKLVYGDENKISEKFATIDIKTIREMRETDKSKQKLYYSTKIKKIIRFAKFKKYMIDAFISVAN